MTAKVSKRYSYADPVFYYMSEAGVRCWDEIVQKTTENNKQQDALIAQLVAEHQGLA